MDCRTPRQPSSSTRVRYSKYSCTEIILMLQLSLSRCTHCMDNQCLQVVRVLTRFPAATPLSPCPSCLRYKMSHIARYPQATEINKGNHLQTLRSSPKPPPKSPAQLPRFSFCKFPALTTGPHKADAPAMGRMTRVHPTPSLPPLSHCTCLILS